ncbi:unnamed protein product [Ostreobium quekettii]|uniref:Autophagy protein ATG17-like domain-containing protein n=1 Tax=Ostreobium quekettii TaxID=121088 RepID=A0A8S1JBT0_9CHLO|nr:unnamed protein product [Ostreobium quekettii]|eukprot:evm.model.scf_426.7 EVM.evm.TU.scf_426.7   scf_426:55238-58435(+)
MPGGSVVLVLVAHNGRTLQLGSVQPATRVDAVQEVLEELAGIPVGEQIVMCRGLRLDPRKPLSVYRLPAEDDASAEDNPVFLYSKAFVRPGAVPLAPEGFEEVEVKVPPMGGISVEHPLRGSPSPLVRALPDYELAFQHHLLLAQEHWDVSQKYVQRCHQLLSEQEVQSRAIDAARANVQTHFNAISRAFTEFMAEYREQHARHSEALATVDRDVEQLSSTAIHQDLRTDKWRRLCDLVPQKQLREWAAGCGRAHARFADKVADLEGLFASLKSDVESLFMQAPTVDLDDLGALLQDREQLLEEEGSIIQVLSKDMRTVRALVEDTVQLLGTERLATTTAHDACGAMESMNQSHMQQLVPRLRDCNSSLAAFCRDCTGCKNRMTRDVASQLQSISTQQSRILEMKNKLAAFKEVATKQDEAFAELMVVHRIPAAYRASLAECVRRRAWSQVYCGQVSRLAEHMGKVRLKEVQKREKFQRHVEGYLPSEMLVKMGLFVQPSHCQMSVPPEEGSLLAISVEDLNSLCTDADSTEQQVYCSLMPSQSDEPVLEDAGSSEHAGSEVQDAFSAETSHIQRLEMQNSKLRAHYAAQIAYQNMKEAEETMKTYPSGEVEWAAKEKIEQNVVSKLKEALKAWEAVNCKLEGKVAALRKQNLVYEDRIRQLEERVADISGSQQEEGCHTVVQLHVSIVSEPSSHERNEGEGRHPEGADGADGQHPEGAPSTSGTCALPCPLSYPPLPLATATPQAEESVCAGSQSAVENPVPSNSPDPDVALTKGEGRDENGTGGAAVGVDCPRPSSDLVSHPAESGSLLGVRSRSPGLLSSATEYLSVASVSGDEPADTRQAADDRPFSPDSVPEILSHSSEEITELIHQSVQDASKLYERLAGLQSDSKDGPDDDAGGPSTAH